MRRFSLVTAVLLIAGCGGKVLIYDGPDSGTSSGGGSSGSGGASSGSGGSSGSVGSSGAGFGLLDSGSPAPTVLCNGRTFTPDPNCSVSFREILIDMSANQWGCAAASCHGGTTPLNMPAIDPANPKGTYKALTNYVVTNPGGATDLFYVNPCSTEPAQSGISCNLGPSATCGSSPMPIVGGSTIANEPSALDRTKLATWLKCGAPDN